MVEEWPRSGTFYYGLVTAGYGYQALSEWKHIPVPPYFLYKGFWIGKFGQVKNL